MKKVFILFVAPLCSWFAALVLSGGLAHAQPPGRPPGQADLDAKLNEVLEKLDAVSCAASGFIDNLDGTVCGCVRNLMWEKKTGMVGEGVECDSPAACPDPHDVNNGYSWSSTGEEFDGTVKTLFLDRLNDVAGGGGTNCFAGHCDWRLPEAGEETTAKELESIVDLGKGFCGDLAGACINPIFGPTAVDSGYWSSNTVNSSPFLAWSVDFSNGDVQQASKDSLRRHARAVRSCE